MKEGLGIRRIEADCGSLRPLKNHRMEKFKNWKTFIVTITEKRIYIFLSITLPAAFSVALMLLMCCLRKVTACNIPKEKVNRLMFLFAKIHMSFSSNFQTKDSTRFVSCISISTINISIVNVKSERV